MLSVGDLLLVVVTTVVCTALVSLLAWGALHVNRRGGIVSQAVIVVIAAVSSIALTTLAVMVEMYFDAHDLTVLAWVMGASGTLSVLVSWRMLRRRVRRSVAGLAESARRIGDGAVLAREVDAPAPTWREFEQLSSELADMSARLGRARAEIEDLDAARRQYVAWISHDLRTPLAGLQALVEGLDEGVVEDPQEYLASIRGRVATLSSLVDDLFELSRIQSGTLHLRRETVSLLDIVSDAVADVMPQARARGLRIVPRGVEGPVLRADPRELTRAITNLLGNGVRHSPDGGEIVVSADLLGPDRLVLSVLDQGPGVASEDLGHIFDVGWRSDPARDQASAGAGLGLAIVRGIAEAHGGSVRAAHVDGGFRLDLVLPR